MKKDLLILFFPGVLLSFIVLGVVAQTIFYKGVDLSYVNNPEDSGVKYYENGQQKPFAVIKGQGVNVVRFRLWCNPAWTSYSDFHYSDFWAAPSRQMIPKTWGGVINKTTFLADSVYNYTFSTLRNMLCVKLFDKQRRALCFVNSLYFAINYFNKE